MEQAAANVMLFFFLFAKRQVLNLVSIVLRWFSFFKRATVIHVKVDHNGSIF